MEGRHVRTPAALGAALVAFAAFVSSGVAGSAVPHSIVPPYPDVTVPVTVDTDPSGLEVSLDGLAPQVTPFVFDCTVGSSHAVTAITPQPGGPDTRYVFVQWTDGVVSNLRTIVCDAPATFVARYRTQYFLTIGADIGTTSPGSGWWDADTTIAIEWIAPPPVPGVRYVSIGWSGAGAGSYTGPQNPVTIVMLGPIFERASVGREFQFVFETSPAALEMLVDGVAMVAPATFWWPEGSVHIVACPTPQGPWRFQAWDDGVTDNPRMFNATAPATRSCLFALGPTPIAAIGRFVIPIIPDPGVPSVRDAAPPGLAANVGAPPEVRSPIPEPPPTG